MSMRARAERTAGTMAGLVCFMVGSKDPYGISYHTPGMAPPPESATGAGMESTRNGVFPFCARLTPAGARSEEHTSELQSRLHLVCRLLLEKKKNMTC